MTKIVKNLYAICPDRTVLLKSKTISQARKECLKKYPDAYEIKREIIRKDIKETRYKL